MKQSRKKHDNKSALRTAELPKIDELRQELRRERYKRRFRRVLRSTIDALIVVAAVAAIVATLVLPVLQIAGTSMEPNLNDGDIVILAKTDKLETGDLCAFYYSNKILIKRVIATPGDYLWIEPDGTVFVNAVELVEPYVQNMALGECDIEFPYQVPENNYFVMVAEQFWKAASPWLLTPFSKTIVVSIVHPLNAAIGTLVCSVITTVLSETGM